MRLKSLLLAAAALAPLASANVWGLTFAQVATINANDVLRVAGSTATDPALKNYFALLQADPNAVCQDGTLDIYTKGNDYVVTCASAGNVTGLTAGTFIAIEKQTAGGSAIGIHNVASAIATAGFIDLSSITAANCPTNAPQYNPVPTGLKNPAPLVWTCGGATESSQVPNAGISDEDPNTFVGTGGVTSSDASILKAGTPGIVPQIQLPFGVIVSIDLRNKLQDIEFVNDPNSCGGAGATNRELATCVPRLTRPVLRSLFAGLDLDWQDIWMFDDSPWDPDSLTPPGPDFLETSVGPTGTPVAPVHICRRGDTSGTELAANIEFFGQGCSTGSGIGSISPPDNAGSQASGEAWTASATQLAAFVFAGSGTGDVVKCVSADNVVAGDPNYRIGIVGADNKSSDTLHTSHFRFIAIDEWFPALFSIQLGHYDWVMEDTFQATASTLNGADRNSIWTFMGNGHFNSKVSLAAYNGTFHDAACTVNFAGTAGSVATPHGQDGMCDTGLLVRPNATTPDVKPPLNTSGGWPTHVRDIGAGQGPVSTQSRTYPGQPANNCNHLFQLVPNG
jgi:hypothetical protein